MQDLNSTDLINIIEMIRLKYGYDFSNYAISSFRRRVLRLLELRRLTPASLLAKLESQPLFLAEFVNEVTVNVTEMFRDHHFWNLLRTEIIPALRAAAPIRIWHAGCSSGEEVFTMAILLREMGLTDNAVIIATDIDAAALEKGRSGIFPIKSMELNERNYKEFGGTHDSLSGYYYAQDGQAIFDKDLVRGVSFFRHDLVTGPVIRQFDLILCRNVMIYFNQRLQNEVLLKFHKSLSKMGFLAIGSRESLIWSDLSHKFAVVHSGEKIYQKIKD